MNAPTRSRLRAGYTLLELLVVITIAALLIGLAVPAFRGILESSRRTLAESKLQQALYAARDAATASTGAGDAAAVFTFEPGGGVRVLTCIEVGSLLDETPTGLSFGGGGGVFERRDVFVPISTFEPVQLPPGTGVRGFVLGSSFQNEVDWFDRLEGFVGSGTPIEPGFWVFPETAYFDGEEIDSGNTRQSFMVRFTQGEGTLSRDLSRALVLEPALSETESVANIEDLAEADDLEIWAKRLLSRADADDRQRRVLGNESVHTILVGPVTELALYEERELARAIGARGVNRESGTVFLPTGDLVEVDRAVYADSYRRLTQFASQWIEGRLDVVDAGVADVGDAQARLFAVNAFFGDLVEINR
ncbi:MAG: prepilin-type N-terminal cleavage/methylation domain-containing protein [Planctomycetota bacterium]